MSVRPRGFTARPHQTDTVRIREGQRRHERHLHSISTHAGQPGRTRAHAARPFRSYLWAGWGADPQPWEGHWRAGGGLRSGWGHCLGGGEARWPMAVAEVAVWCGRWRGRPPCQPARGYVERAVEERQREQRAVVGQGAAAHLVGGAARARVGAGLWACGRWLVLPRRGGAA